MDRIQLAVFTHQTSPVRVEAAQYSKLISHLQRRPRGSFNDLPLVILGQEFAWSGIDSLVWEPEYLLLLLLLLLVLWACGQRGALWVRTCASRCATAGRIRLKRKNTGFWDRLVGLSDLAQAVA
jgi:hypothetical protein